LICSWKV